MIYATIDRRLSTEEVRELLYFMEHQETGERFVETEILLKGNNNTLNIITDENGDVTVLKNIGEGLKKIERGLFYQYYEE